MARKGKKEKASKGKGGSGTQEAPVEKRRSRVFASKGYIVTCRLHGLEIETVDYHAGKLRISWRDLERLMVESGLVPPREKRESQRSSRSSVN